MSNLKADANAKVGSVSSRAQGPFPVQAPVANVTARPSYAAAFECIGASCEDTCCKGWPIPLDQATYKQYRGFPDERLGSVVTQYVKIAVNAPASHFAKIVQTESGACPFFNTDRMCDIHKQYGAKLLSTTCSTYPRALNRVHGVLEGSLLLSCPEAARNVLLDPYIFEGTGDLDAGKFRTDSVVRLANNRTASIQKPYAFFDGVQQALILTVRDRSRPLWQRLLLIGSLCKSLDEVLTDEAEAKVPVILDDHRRALEGNLLRAELEGIPAQPALQLNIFLRLTDERVRDKTSGARFRDMFWTFVEGIGSAVEAEPGADIERYLEAEERYHRPFFACRPYILENFLVNYLFQNLFPFGRENTLRSTPRRIFEEYVLLATQFAWINTLLIGTAGYAKQEFAEEHVVHVVQSFCREVEHNPYVLISMVELMAHLRLDNLQGMAILLKH
jgi:lysine-N-methylase